MIEVSLKLDKYKTFGLEFKQLSNWYCRLWSAKLTLYYIEIYMGYWKSKLRMR